MLRFYEDASFWKKNKKGYLGGQFNANLPLYAWVRIQAHTQGFLIVCALVMSQVILLSGQLSR